METYNLKAGMPKIDLRTSVRPHHFLKVHTTSQHWHPDIEAPNGRALRDTLVHTTRSGRGISLLTSHYTCCWTTTLEKGGFRKQICRSQMTAYKDRGQVSNSLLGVSTTTYSTPLPDPLVASSQLPERPSALLGADFARHLQGQPGKDQFNNSKVSLARAPHTVGFF